MHPWMSLLELANDVSGVCGDACQTYYDQDSPGDEQWYLASSAFRVPGLTYGRNPNAANADGSDKIPNETVSAIITGHFNILLVFRTGLRMSRSGKGCRTDSTLPEFSRAETCTLAIVAAVRSRTYHQVNVRYLTSADSSLPKGSSASGFSRANFSSAYGSCMYKPCSGAVSIGSGIVTRKNNCLLQLVS